MSNFTTVLHCILLSLKFRPPSEFFLVARDRVHIMVYRRIAVTKKGTDL
jgi:hypothetical protein